MPLLPSCLCSPAALALRTPGTPSLTRLRSRLANCRRSTFTVARSLWLLATHTIRAPFPSPVPVPRPRFSPATCPSAHCGALLGCAWRTPLSRAEPMWLADRLHYFPFNSCTHGCLEKRTVSPERDFLRVLVVCVMLLCQSPSAARAQCVLAPTHPLSATTLLSASRLL